MAVWADCDFLIYSLEMARYWDEKMTERLPANFNHLLSTGYFTTPSARMTLPGDIAFGVSDVPPYLNINGRLQPFSHLEISANYRIFRGVEDQGLSKEGFGDYADRGANFKLAITLPEEIENFLPGIAIGIEDFMGSKKFTNYFIVATKIWLPEAFETSVGWGAGSYTHGPSRGFFGGVAWFPFWETCGPWREGFSAVLEYDPTNYKEDPHPLARFSRTPLNAGVKYNYKDLFGLSVSRVRGDAWALAGSINYNWGRADGFLPKIQDSLPYTAPIVKEPLGCIRPESIMIQELNYALEEQGFCLTKAWLEENGCNKILWINVVNQKYRREEMTRDRIQHVLAALLPADIDMAVVVIESYGLPCQQYVYLHDLLTLFSCHHMGPFEFDLLTPRENVTQSEWATTREIFFRRLDPWRIRYSPRLETFFGSAKGKFKYDFGVRADIEGFLPKDIFYELQLSYTLASTINNIGSWDKYNPSQLPNVLTDYVIYRQQKHFSTDKAYLQKNWNLGCGLFGRISGGYFQVNYGGIAGELLWYPANKCLALGVEGAILKKRSYTGLGFQNKLRQLDGYTPTYIPYTTLQQWFFDLYLDLPAWNMAAKLSAGQFLAKDFGGRIEVTRYFESGLRLTGWMTVTNAEDVMHGEKYFNRGIAIELPLDLFYRCSSRKVWNYGLAAWLRDAGAFIPTGKGLFEMINRERRW